MKSATFPKLDELFAAPWEMESAQLVVFLEHGQIEFDPETWWTACIGEPPTLASINRQLGFSDYQGPFSGHHARLSISPNRIDWVLSGAETTVESSAVPKLGYFPSKEETIFSRLQVWLEKFSPPCNRIGLVTTLFKPVPDRASGYSFMNKFLHNSLRRPLDPEKDFDFLFGLNRRGTVPDVIKPNLINRIVQISTAQRTVQIRSGGSFEVLPPTYAVRLYADFNTFSEAKFQNQGANAKVFDALVQQLATISMEGDSAWI